ncbi:hypothetical protein DPMN_148731 [Dreissena polymorpha]|uniref:C-type lectin domain-containing protein n=1 Tax=Dreissena polymorpha TaxID=45954 RepID=A0A9D4J4A2_DREPO|nr:hypothetical protein DPMN_148731 [Dreissena polymorpha]
MADRQAWIGIHFKDGSWISSNDGRLAAYVNWALGEPNDGNVEPCAITWGRFQWRWADVGCTHETHAVCEIDM